MLPELPKSDVFSGYFLLVSPVQVHEYSTDVYGTIARIARIGPVFRVFSGLFISLLQYCIEVLTNYLQIFILLPRLGRSSVGINSQVHRKKQSTVGRP